MSRWTKWSLTIAGVLAAVPIMNAGEGKREQQEIPGCYELVVGALTAPTEATDMGQSHAWPPPSRIQLTSEAPSAAEREAPPFVPQGLAVRPQGVAAGDPLFELGVWTREGDTVRIFWNGGFSGVVIEAKRRDIDWVGTLTFRSDEIGRAMRSAPVTMRRYPCK